MHHFHHRNIRLAAACVELNEALGIRSSSVSVRTDSGYVKVAFNDRDRQIVSGLLLASKANGPRTSPEAGEKRDSATRPSKTRPPRPIVRFNQTVILAKLSDYKRAIDKMKCYLKLSPYAFNVRAAKDKIAEWETQVPRSLNDGFSNKKSSDRIQEKIVVS